MTCPFCNAEACEEQPEAGTHISVLNFVCGTKLLFCIGHGNDYEVERSCQ